MPGLKRQAPYGTAEHVMHMLKDSKLPLNQLDYISSYTVGYGQKEHLPSRSTWRWRRCTPRAARYGWRWTAGSISSSRSSAILSHKTWLECGTQIVPELVSGQIQGGVAMGIGHALYEDLPRHETGPGNG